MSALGDLIIRSGPYFAAQLNPITSATADELNALRDELIERRSEVARWRRGHARAWRYRDSCEAKGERNEANAITEALRAISAVVNGTDVNA